MRSAQPWDACGSGTCCFLGGWGGIIYQKRGDGWHCSVNSWSWTFRARVVLEWQLKPPRSDISPSTQPSVRGEDRPQSHSRAVRKSQRHPWSAQVPPICVRGVMIPRSTPKGSHQPEQAPRLSQGFCNIMGEYSFILSGKPGSRHRKPDMPQK